VVSAALPKGRPGSRWRSDPAAHGPWAELRAGLFALFRFKDARVAESALVSGGKSRFDWWAATYVAMRLESPLLKPVLVEAAGSTGPLSRAIAARGLGALKDSSVVDLLAQLARDREPGVAVAACPRPRCLRATAGRAPVAARWARATSRSSGRPAGAGVAAPDRGPRARVVPYVARRSPDPAAALQAWRLDRDESRWCSPAWIPTRVVRSGRPTRLGLADEVSATILH
jgi:hypothetical protein